MHHKKLQKIFGYAGLLLLIIYGLFPLGWINETSITLFPLFDNYVSDFKLWQWNDISAFVMTHVILIIIVVVGFVKNNNLLVRFCCYVLMINTVLILVAVIYIQIHSLEFQEAEFRFGYSWIFFISGISLLIFSTKIFPERFISNGNNFDKYP